MNWSIESGQNTDWCSWQYWFCRFCRALWSVVYYISLVDWYSGGASQECMRLQCAQKLCIDGLIELHGQNIDFCYGITVFQVLRILLVYGRASFAGGKVFRSSQSTLCTTGVDQKIAIHGLIQYKWPEHWFDFMAKLYSRCWRPFWSVVEHLTQVERCSGWVTQHYVPRQ